MHSSVLLALAFLLGGVIAQTITNKAMQRIFKYADPKAVGKLTASINKEHTLPARIKRVSAWIPANLVKKGAKVPPGAPEADKKLALEKATSFLNYRAVLVKVINLIFTNTKALLTPKLANKLRTMFWKLDKKTNNDFMKTEALFNRTGIPLIPQSKRADYSARVVTVKNSYLEKNPADIKYAMWFLQ